MAAASLNVDKPELRVLLCAPRGFCAGVVRAIDSVKQAIEVFGAPVYVRRQIVHNRYVVDSLAALGAVFVESLDEVPDCSAPILFSAHGVAKSVNDEVIRRGFFSIDATCPLVTKVHREVEILQRRGLQVVLIGHRNHPEVVGTLGQLAPGVITLIETLEDAASFIPQDPGRLAYVTQTTLSVDETALVIECLRRRFPALVGPPREDICYATTNRQEAVKRVAPQVEAMIVVGSSNSSNSHRLKETAERMGCVRAFLVERAADFDWSQLDGLSRLGVTAGASTPEVLIDEVIDTLATRYELDVEIVTGTEETAWFPLPRLLRQHGEVG